MKTAFTLPLALAAVMTFSTAAMAQQTALDFAMLDSDSDGLVSLEEFKAAGLSEETFGAVDTDKDGSVSTEEVTAYNETIEEQ